MQPNFLEGEVWDLKWTVKQVKSPDALDERKGETEVQVPFVFQKQFEIVLCLRPGHLNLLNPGRFQVVPNQCSDDKNFGATAPQNQSIWQKSKMLTSFSLSSEGKSLNRQIKESVVIS